MMKTTYLIYKQVNGIRQLAEATPEEWDAILKENRGLPIKKNFFRSFKIGKQLRISKASFDEWLDRG